MSDATVASAKTANKVLASGERSCGAMAEHKGAVRSKAEPWNEKGKRWCVATIAKAWEPCLFRNLPTLEHVSNANATFVGFVGDRTQPTSLGRTRILSSPVVVVSHPHNISNLAVVGKNSPKTLL